MVSAENASWSAADSAALYGIDRWGDPYFSVNARGHISVQPKGERGGSLDLLDLVQGLEGRSLGLPLLIRFDDILDCLLYTSPSPRDKRQSRMPSSA